MVSQRSSRKPPVEVDEPKGALRDPMWLLIVKLIMFAFAERRDGGGACM